MALPRPARLFLGPLLENEVLFVVCTSTMLVMLGQGITGPILPLFAKSFGVSTAAVGLTLSVFAGARMLVNIPSGLAADRWGRRVLLVGGPVVTGLGSLLSAGSFGLYDLLAWRFVAGVGSAMYMTGAIIVVTDIAEEHNRGRMLALNQGALLLGVTLGPAVGGIVAELAGLRAPFIVVGAAGIAAGVWNLLRVAETRPPAAPTASLDALNPTARIRRVRNAAGAIVSVSFLLIGLVTFAVFFARSGRQTILPLFGNEGIGLSEGTIGSIFAMMAFMNLLLIVPAGAMVDRFGAKATIVPSALVSGVGFFLFVIADNLLEYALAGVVLGTGSGILGPAPPAYVASVVSPEARGTAMGMFRTLGDFGFVIAPPLVGTISDASGFTWAIMINGLVLMGSSIAFGLLASAPRPVTTRQVPA